MKRLLMLGALLALVVCGAAACQPAPQPGTVDIAGDSVSDLSDAMTPVRPTGANTEMVKAGNACHDVEVRLREHVAAARPETLIWALGPNDADPARGGWGLDDMACWFGALDESETETAVHPDTTVVIIVPGYTQAWPAPWRAEIDEARGFMRQLDDVGGPYYRPNTCVVEGWQQILNAHPEYTPDGIHPATVEAAEAWFQLIDQGVRGC